jgi:hypothetical protein
MAIDDAPTILGPWPAAPAVGHRRAVDSGLRPRSPPDPVPAQGGGVQGPWPATTAETSPAAWTRRASASDGTDPRRDSVDPRHPTCRSSGRGLPDRPQ